MVGPRLLVTLLAVAAAVVLAAAAPGSAAPAVGASARVGDLVLTVPRGFERDETRRDRRLVGILLTNYHVLPHGPTITMGVFPADGVALVLARWRGPVAAPQLRLPLRLGELRGPQHHADGAAWNGVLRFRGSLYSISFWCGRAAPSRDRSALLHALSSIHGAR